MGVPPLCPRSFFVLVSELGYLRIVLSLELGISAVSPSLKLLELALHRADLISELHDIQVVFLLLLVQFILFFGQAQLVACLNLFFDFLQRLQPLVLLLNGLA